MHYNSKLADTNRTLISQKYCRLKLATTDFMEGTNLMCMSKFVVGRDEFYLSQNPHEFMCPDAIFGEDLLATWWVSGHGLWYFVYESSYYCYS